MRFAVVDLECSGLKGDQGFLLCGGIKELGRPGRVIGFKEAGFENGRLKIDRKLAVRLRDEMEKFDGWITWNGLLFDLPFLDDRLMLCGEDPLERRFARGLDMMWHARQGKSTFQSSRLDWVAKAFGCPVRKTALDLNTWKEAEAEALAHFANGRKNYSYITEHCLRDLEVTEWAFNKLKPRVVTISKR